MGSFGILACLAAFLAMASVEGGRRSLARSDNNYVRGCYYTNWAQYRPDKGKYVPDNYIPGLCTHIFYAFVTMENNFQLKPFEWNDEDTDWSLGMYHKVLNQKQKQPDLKVLLSFGGWTFSQANAGLLSNMASTAANRATFINSVVKFVRRINFDGFDIDWEYPEARDKTNYALLVKEMRAAFEKDAQESGKPRLLLTAAVAAGINRIDAGYDGQSLGKDFDYVNIMSYDFHGGWEQQTGFNSPLYDRNGDQLAISVAADYWNKIGVPKSKLLVGLGTYGRGWKLANKANSGVGAATGGAPAQLPYSREGGIATYYEICDLIEKQGYQEFYDEQQQSPYVVGGDGVWFGYDNVKSFNFKLDWIKQNGFGGAFIWALDFDDFQGQCQSSNGQKYPLMSAINAKLGGGVVPQPQPGPQPTPAPGPRPTPAPQPKPTAAPQPGPQPTPRPTQNPSGPFQCPGDGIFADSASCTSFYQCYNGVAYQQRCPPGLEFNAAASICDWPDSAKCSKQG